MHKLSLRSSLAKTFPGWEMNERRTLSKIPSQFWPYILPINFNLEASSIKLKNGRKSSPEKIREPKWKNERGQKNGGRKKLYHPSSKHLPVSINLLSPWANQNSRVSKNVLRVNDRKTRIGGTCVLRTFLLFRRFFLSIKHKKCV